MHGEDLLVNDSCNWQAVEAIGESLPELNVISTLAFIIESINAVNGCTFVVTTENEEVLRVFDLVCQEQADRF